MDASVWREVGDPLVRGAAEGPLARTRVAVKDLFAVEGHPIGAGVPAFLEQAGPEPRTAPAVRALLDAGADVAGIARTDEFAYSIAGANPHFGTPPNPRVPGGLPGGSSNGPASAVALGQADAGLGTDTGGSIRVPASYQGLWGLRTTHGRVPRDGMLPLAPSFDTVGWLTRDPGVLAACAAASAPGGPGLGRAVVAPGLADDLEPGVVDAFTRIVERLVADGRLPQPEPVDLGDVAAVQEAFRIVQAAEAWSVHGPWLTAHPGAVVGAVAERFRIASTILEEDAAAARERLRTARERWAAALGDGVLLLPSASSAAPPTAASGPEIDRVRRQTLRLTCIAGTLGAPALSAPLIELDGGPLGLCFVGPRDSDDALVALGASLA